MAFLGVWLAGAAVAFWKMSRWDEVQGEMKMDPVTFTAVLMLSLFWPLLLVSFIITKILWKVKK